MSFFNAIKTAVQQPANKRDQRSSLDAFKAKADQSVLVESIDRITGGALAGCHPIKRLA